MAVGLYMYYVIMVSIIIITKQYSGTGILSVFVANLKNWHCARTVYLADVVIVSPIIASIFSILIHLFKC